MLDPLQHLLLYQGYLLHPLHVGANLVFHLPLAQLLFVIVIVDLPLHKVMFVIKHLHLILLYFVGPHPV